MKVKDLIASCDLEDVDHVGVLPAEARTRGDEENVARLGYPMNVNFCWENAQSVVDGMMKIGDNEWTVVYGFATWTDGALCAHVWVRKGAQHFDPTWPIAGCPLDACRYFSVTAKNVSVTSFKTLKDIGTRWGLELRQGIG